MIPAYNEENRLPCTLGRVFDYLHRQDYTYEVIVVENGSSDRTLELTREAAQAHPSLRAMHIEGRGKGLAVREGMLAAQGDYRFICDADLSMPIEEIAKFLPPALEGFDLAIGSREATGAVRYDEPAYRHWGGRLINLAIRILILPGLQDTQCGFKCFRAQAAEQLFQRQRLPGWSFDIEVLFLARRFDMKIREIPINWYYDSESKVSAVRDALKMIGDILRIHFNARRGRYDLDT